MRRCPKCRRDYLDETLSFCLEDGTPLVYGIEGTEDQEKTAILPGFLHDKDATIPYGSLPPDQGIPVKERPSEPAAETLVRDRKGLVYLTVAVLLLAGAVFLGYRYFAADDGKQIESIAIMPFENGSGDSSLEYLSDGISESLINDLSQLPGIKVIARSSSFKYRGKETDVGEIARALGVQAILTGRVTKHEDKLAISVDLTDARDKSQMWGEKYERKATDLLALETEISNEISRKLRLRLSTDQRQQFARQKTNDAEAYELLLKGRFFWQKAGTENRMKAVEYYKQAIDVDPSYALAHAELSVRYSNLVADSILDPKEFTPKAEIELLKALALDDTLADGHLALANFKSNAWAWSDAEKEYQRAIQLNANLSEAHRWYANYLGAMKRHNEAIAEIKRAKEIDPISIPANADIGFTLFMARRYDEAIESLKQTVDLDPGYSTAYAYLGYTYTAKKMYPEAISAFEHALKYDPDGTSNQIYLAAAYAGSGNDETARSILDRLQRSGKYMSPMELATLYVALGEQDKALASIEKAYEARDLQLQYLSIDPSLDAIRNTTRFKDLVRRVGLPD